MDNTLSPTTRFSSRVGDYVKYRPDYPRELVEILRREAGLAPGWIIADVGCGTGISSRMFLENGNEVFGVEPNDDMCAAAEQEFQGNSRFHPVKGTAEATTLGDASVDLVVVCQAFHWFDRPVTAREFKRILRSVNGGYVALIWNQRLTETDAFAAEYAQLLERLGNRYKDVAHRWSENCDALAADFGAPFQRFSAPNRQLFDLTGLKGRSASSSYVPQSGQPGHREFYAELSRLFDRHQKDGIVRFEYETELFLGRVCNRNTQP